MIELGLSVDDLRSFHAALRQSHLTRIQVDVLNRDEQVIAGLPKPYITSGAVNADMSAAATRSLEMTLVDPEGRLEFIPASPSDAGVFADNFLAVRRGIYVEELSRWVDVPIFWGPLTGVTRDGDEITVKAMGKESLALRPAVVWKPLTIKQRTTVEDAVKKILQGQGEARFGLDTLSPQKRIPRPVSLARTTEAWKVCRKIVGSQNRQLYYDGLGRVRLRAFPGQPLYTFRSGEAGSITTKPKLDFDMSGLRNLILVLGVKPSGPGKRPHAIAQPPAEHPLSPQSLARNGKPRYLVEVVKAKHARRRSQCQKIADRVLAEKLAAAVTISFEALPVPHLEEGDMVALEHDGVTYSFQLRQFTIPLTSDEAQSFGFLKRIPLSKRKVT